MAEYIYKIETIEDYDDDAITEAALNALSVGEWELKTVTYTPTANGKSTATLIYIKSLSSSSSSRSSSSSSSSSSSISSSSISSSSSSSSSLSSSSSSSAAISFKTVILSPSLDGVFSRATLGEDLSVTRSAPADSWGDYHALHNRAVAAQRTSTPPPAYRITRSFFVFDLSSLNISYVVTDVRLKATSAVIADGSGFLQQGTLSDPLSPTVNDFVSYSTQFTVEIDYDYGSGQRITMPMNNDGVQYVQNILDSTAYVQLFWREWGDLTSSPGITNKRLGLYFEEDSVPSRRPTLEIDVEFSSSLSSSSVSSSSSSSLSSSSSSTSSSSSSSSTSSSSSSSSSSTSSTSSSSVSSSSISTSSSSVSLSSSSVSSSSTSISSSSVSSSSISELPFMGTGWPYPPDQLQVTIGSRWNSGSFGAPFVEDDVITLTRVDTFFPFAFFTEDGTLIPDKSTNRLRITYQGGTYFADKMQAWVPSYFEGTWYPAIDVTHGYNPYDFGRMFTNSFTFTYYAHSTFFDVTAHTFSPAASYNGEVFKTFTFINN